MIPREYKDSSCLYCRYFKPIGGYHFYYWGCHYLLETNKQRGCEPEDCDKKEEIDDLMKLKYYGCK